MMNTFETLHKIAKFVDQLQTDEANRICETPTPSDMSDEEFLARYAKLGEEWLPEWVDEGGRRRFAAYDSVIVPERWNNITNMWVEIETIGSNYCLAALCETHATKKLREMKAGIDYSPSRNVDSYEVSRLWDNGGNEDMEYLDTDGKWEGNAACFPTHRHALLAAMEAVKLWN